MIHVSNLTKHYGDFQALKNVSFDVAKGEILGFLGPNGAGKTTTMRILTGYLPPTSGTVTVAGFDVTTDSLEVRKRLGYLPETVPLYPEMTVWGYLEFMARLRGVDKRERRIGEAMEKVRIADHADVMIGKLSKGYRQRLGLAQALLHDPEVLILDEPTIGLDPRQIIEVRELIRGLAQDHTVILSTHILPEVSQTCTRVLIINEGEIVAEGTPERLMARLKGAERIFVQLAGAKDDEALHLFRSLDGILAVDEKGDGAYEVECALGTDKRPEIAREIVSRGWSLLELRPVGMSLEEIFLKLTTE